MFDLSQTVLIASFVLCFLLLICAIPIATYLRKQSSSPGWNYRGLVRIESLEKTDLLGLSLLLILYTFLSLMKLPQLTEMISQAVPGIMVVVFLVFRKIDMVEFFGLRWKEAPFILLIGPIGAIVSQAVFMIMEMAGYSTALESIFGDIKPQEILRIYQENDQVSIRILLAVMAVVIAPIVEEVVFRGYIYPVCKRHSGRVIATFVTSLFFSAVHFSIPALLPLFILAIFLTIAYELSGSIWVPIAIHACFNGFTLIAQEFIPPA